MWISLSGLGSTLWWGVGGVGMQVACTGTAQQFEGAPALPSTAEQLGYP